MRRNESGVHGIVVLGRFFAAALTATTVIPLLSEDVHVVAWLVEFVEEVVHFKIKLEVFIAL